METVTLNIPSISCNHCVMTVKRETGFVDGAQFVEGDVDARTATFRIRDAAALASLRKTLGEAGYPPQE